MKKTFTLLFLAAAFAATAQKVSLNAGTAITNSLFTPAVSIEYGQVVHKDLEITAALGSYKSSYRYAITDALGNPSGTLTDVQDFLSSAVGFKYFPINAKVRPFVLGNITMLLPNSRNWLENKIIFAYTGGVGLEYEHKHFFYNTKATYTKAMHNAKDFFSVSIGFGVRF